MSRTHAIQMHGLWDRGGKGASYSAMENSVKTAEHALRSAKIADLAEKPVRYDAAACGTSTLPTEEPARQEGQQVFPKLT